MASPPVIPTCSTCPSSRNGDRSATGTCRRQLGRVQFVLCHDPFRRVQQAFWYEWHAGGTAGLRRRRDREITCFPTRTGTSRKRWSVAYLLAKQGPRRLAHIERPPGAFFVACPRFAHTFTRRRPPAPCSSPVRPRRDRHRRGRRTRRASSRRTRGRASAAPPSRARPMTRRATLPCGAGRAG